MRHGLGLTHAGAGAWTGVWARTGGWFWCRPRFSNVLILWGAFLARYSPQNLSLAPVAWDEGTQLKCWDTEKVLEIQGNLTASKQGTDLLPLHDWQRTAH